MLVVVALTAACAAPVTPDLVITNARVFTNDTARPWVEAIAIKGERVVGLGDVAAVAAMTGAATRVIDAGGRVLVPGFNDARVDLPLGEAPTPASLSVMDRAAIAQGVTSLQVVAGGPMRTLVEAARQAQRQARWRLIRSPMDGELPQDEKPFLPPQPGVRLLASGVAWQFGSSVRGQVSPSRLPTAVKWAYGAEDPIVMAGDARPWIEALSSEGLPEVWKRKRPRLDLLRPVTPADVAGLVRLGVVVVLGPPVMASHSPPGASAGALADTGVTLALGTSHPRALSLLPGEVPMRLLDVLAEASSAYPAAAGRTLTREEAVRAATWGSAYAEKAERDKGWLGEGTLADIAILSDDIFTLPPEAVSDITSVLTLVGGLIVYDAGVLQARQ